MPQYLSNEKGVIMTYYLYQTSDNSSFYWESVAKLHQSEIDKKTAAGIAVPSYEPVDADYIKYLGKDAAEKRKRDKKAKAADSNVPCVIGAIIGAILLSVIPVVGTIIGAIVGWKIGRKIRDR
jgi:hypothetical protein